MEEEQELNMNVGEKEEEEGGQPRPSSWRNNCDQTEGPKPEIEEHRIDVEISDRVRNWIGSVGKAKERRTASLSQTSWPSIPKVPHLLRGTKDFNKFFQPRVISIGPYHHGKPHLHSVEKIKPLFALEFLAASQQGIEDVYEKIKSNIGAVRKCYDRRPTNKYDDETLAWMMLMDGCFILQFILGNGSIEVLREHQIRLVELDLFLLENQLPFGVLQLIFEEGSLSMIDDIKQYVTADIARLAQVSSVSEMQLEKPAHLLHILRSALLGSGRGGEKKMISNQQQPEQDSPQEQEEKQKADEEQQEQKAANNNNNTHDCWRMMKGFLSFQCLFQMIRRLFGRSKETTYSSSQDNNNKLETFRHIRELKAAGIHFQPSGTSFLKDISFKSHFFYGYLKLPFLFIDDSTKPMFLNLVAYEMCPDAPEDYEVTSFLFFLDSLIDHSDDVKELRSKKILYNSLGSDEDVARIFNEITDGLVYYDVYKDVKADIQKHYDKRVNTWIAQALHDHFSSPWTIMAVIAAVLIILLTGTQTYFAIPGN